MKKLYTAYLSYPSDVDSAIRVEYARAATTWKNKRTFDFKPMIPLWKVKLSDEYEHDLIPGVTLVDIEKLRNLKIKGYETREETGYIFLVFDDTSSLSLCEVSGQLSQLMQVGDAEDHMPYGFEPHTSLIKQEPSVIGEIYASLSHKLDGAMFTPAELVVSKEIKNGSDVTFEVVYSRLLGQ